MAAVQWHSISQLEISTRHGKPLLALIGGVWGCSSTKAQLRGGTVGNPTSCNGARLPVYVLFVAGSSCRLGANMHSCTHRLCVGGCWLFLYTAHCWHAVRRVLAHTVIAAHVGELWLGTYTLVCKPVSPVLSMLCCWQLHALLHSST